MVHFILLCKVVQTIHSVVQIAKCYAGEQYFLVDVVLFFMLYKVALASTKMSKLNPTVTLYLIPTHEISTFYAIINLTEYMGLQLDA